MLTNDIYETIASHSSERIGLLDMTATLVESNQNWLDFISVATTPPENIGVDYLKMYAWESGNTDIKQVRQAIQQLLRGEIKEFTSLYSSTVAGHPQWFSLLALPHQTSDGPRVIIILKDITSLLQPKEMLQQQVEQLSETNIALNTLLKSREQDRATQEGAIVTNVKQLIMPYLERLHQADLGPQEKTLVTIIGEYLNNIISPFLHHMSSINQQLTPQELKVASLIRQGRSSKEISEAMNLSVHGVGFHRKSIRTKLGLTGSGKNLRSQLMALR